MKSCFNLQSSGKFMVVLALTLPIISHAKSAVWNLIHDTWPLSAALLVLPWVLSIFLCRKGGGWIIFGVIIGVFIAIPLTGMVALTAF